MFVPLAHCDLRIAEEGTVEYWPEEAGSRVRPIFDPKRPTALFIGRYQPFHDEHKTLMLAGLRRVGQVCIGVRDTGIADAKKPLAFEEVWAQIEHALRGHEGSFEIVKLPNISHVFYGRDVGDRIHLDESTEATSVAAHPSCLKAPSGNSVQVAALPEFFGS